MNRTKGSSLPSISHDVAQNKVREEFAYAMGETSLGHVLVAFSDFGVVSIILGPDASLLLRKLEARFPQTVLRKDVEQRRRDLVVQTIQYMENPFGLCIFPLDMRGTAFQQRVWRAVQHIPPGTTSTYSEIARQVRAPRAMRAVGSACTHNHFAIIVPCHRVLRKGDTMTKCSVWQRVLLKREIVRAS